MEASSAINTPHPDDSPEEDAAAGFFDEEDGGEEEAAAEAAERAAADDAAGEDEPASDPTSPGESDGPTDADPSETGSATQSPGDGAESDPGQGEGDKTRGAAEREYIVFQKVPLTERVLKALLKQIEDGNAPSPRIAYFELQRETTRNDRTAVAKAYQKNRKTLGEKCELAAVSSRSFKERKVQPREVKPQEDIQIV